MNYKKVYYNIIERAKNRILEDYGEKHHIIPKCLGGINEKENIVKLTAREHFICHLLLTKMISKEFAYKMHKAANMMKNVQGPKQQRYKVNSHLYKTLKEKIEVPLEVKTKMSISQNKRFKTTPGTFLGKSHSDETKKKMSQAASKPKSELWKQSASKNRKGKNAPNKGIPHSDETKRKISLAVSGEKNGFFGKQHSIEQREKKRKEKLNSPRLECPHCSKIIDQMNFARWHGNKCKEKK